MINTSLQIVCAVAIVGAVALADDAPAPSFVGKKAGQVREDNSFKMKLVWCPPGKFTMGSSKEKKDRDNDEVPVQVILTKGFWMGQHEVTEYEWQFVMETTPWTDNGRSLRDDSPATYIRWSDAADFCGKLTQQERQLRLIPATWAYTLPTEAQWEYACRAGTTTRFSFGDDESKLGDYAWFLENAEQTVHQVGLKKANPWGLHDMHGNVCEWTRDWYSPKLAGGTNPEITVRRLYDARTVRGGDYGCEPQSCRSAERLRFKPEVQGHRVGFRITLVQLGK